MAVGSQTEKRAHSSARAVSTRTAVVLVLALAALVVVSPFFFKGDASGHDFEFHVACWMEVVRQWHEGISYPRWAAFANYGYGEPRFIFYPPESWVLGGALASVLPWKMVPAAYIWLVLTLAGAAMYRFAREWLPEKDAAIAGVLFATNPYHLLMVYWRSDFAELLASAIFPLFLLTIMHLAHDPRRAWIPLAVLYAATWLANAPAGVIVSYTTALLVVVLTIREKSWRILTYGAAAVALGLALSAFWLIPAAVEQPWVNISQALSSGLRPQDSFLFTKTADPEHTWFNLLASIVAVAEMAAVALTLGFCSHLRRLVPRLWSVLLSLTLTCVLLMLRLSAPLWEHLPELRFVQFPWRWLFPFGVVFAAFLSTTIARARTNLKVAVSTVLFAALIFCGWRLARGTWWDADSVTDLQEAVLERGSGYEGTDEYTPRGADRYDLIQYAPLVAETGRTSGVKSGYAPVIRMLRWYPQHKQFTVTAGAPTTLILRLLNYPAWRAEANSRVISVESSPGTGQMLIGIPAGVSEVRVDFVRTRDRWWGGAVSALAVIVLIVVLALHGELAFLFNWCQT